MPITDIDHARRWIATARSAEAGTPTLVTPYLGAKGNYMPCQVTHISRHGDKIAYHFDSNDRLANPKHKQYIELEASDLLLLAETLSVTLDQTKCTKIAESYMQSIRELLPWQELHWAWDIRARLLAVGDEKLTRHLCLAQCDLCVDKRRLTQRIETCEFTANGIHVWILGSLKRISQAKSNHLANENPEDDTRAMDSLGVSLANIWEVMTKQDMPV